jgi:hypothetical protein
MKTTQCRLCLAEIPHDYDHTLEIISEKQDLGEEELGEVTFEYIHNPRFRRVQQQQQQKQQWPNSAATTGLLFLLFVSNASLFIVWLILWGLYLKEVEAQKSTDPVIWKVAAVYSIAGTGCFLNGLMVYISERQLGTRLISFVSGIFGLVWCSIVLWVKSKG